MALSEEEQYRQTHHEFAVLNKFEDQSGLASDYVLSDQISSKLENTNVKMLPVTPLGKVVAGDIPDSKPDSKEDLSSLPLGTILIATRALKVPANQSSIQVGPCRIDLVSVSNLLRIILVGKKLIINEPVRVDRPISWTEEHIDIDIDGTFGYDRSIPHPLPPIYELSVDPEGGIKLITCSIPKGMNIGQFEHVLKRDFEFDFPESTPVVGQ
jgi:hypothetical protein